MKIMTYKMYLEAQEAIKLHRGIESDWDDKDEEMKELNKEASDEQNLQAIDNILNILP